MHDCKLLKKSVQAYEVKLFATILAASPEQALERAGNLICGANLEEVEYWLGCEVGCKDTDAPQPLEALLAQCDNCQRIFLDAELDEPSHLWERLDAGSEVPTGECPLCGALCYLCEKERAG
jgi:hypothetical protein